MSIILQDNLELTTKVPENNQRLEIFSEKNNSIPVENFPYFLGTNNVAMAKCSENKENKRKRVISNKNAADRKKRQNSDSKPLLRRQHNKIEVIFVRS